MKISSLIELSSSSENDAVPGSWAAFIPGISTVRSLAASFFNKTQESNPPPGLPQIVYKNGKPLIWPPPAASSQEKAAILIETLFRGDYGEDSRFNEITTLKQPPGLWSTFDLLLMARDCFSLPLEERRVHDLISLQDAMIDEETGIPRSVIARISYPENGYLPRLVVIDEITLDKQLVVRDLDYGSIRVLDQGQFFSLQGSVERSIRVFQALPKNRMTLQCWKEEIVSTWTQAPKSEQDLIKKAIQSIIENVTPNTARSESSQIVALCGSLTP